MAKIPRLNKTILPPSADPSAISRAGGLARGVAQVAGIGGEVAQQFKTAKDVSFVNERSAQFERETDDFFQQAKVDFAGDPDKGKDEFTKFMNQRFTELSRDGSGAAQNTFANVKADIENKYDAKYSDFSRVQTVRNFGTSFDNSIRDQSVLAFREGQAGGDLQDTLNSVDAALLAGSTFLSEGDLSTLGQEARGNITQEYIQGLIENNPSSAKERLAAGEFDDKLTADQLQSLSNSSDRRITFEEAKAQKIIAEQRKATLDDINLRTFESTDPNNEINVTQEEINGLLESGTLSTDQYIKSSKSLESALKTRQDKLLDSQKIGAFDNGEYILDPNNDEDVRAVDNFYQNSVLPSIEQLPPQEQIDKKVDFAVTRGVIPSQLKKEISANLTSGTPDNKVIASNVMTDLVNRNPAMARQFKNTDIAFSAKVVDGVNSGLTPSNAVDFAESQTFLKETPEFKARLESFNNDKSDFKRKNVQEFFRNDPDIVPQSMSNEWETLYRFYNTEQGVEDKRAQELAYDKLLSTWAPSDVAGGLGWVKWAPEAYYSIEGVSNDWMRGQLSTIIGEHNLFPDKKAQEKFINENVEVIPDVRTVRTEKPAYQIIQKIKTKDGDIILDALKDSNGNQLFWVPSFFETPQAKKMQAKLNKSQEELRAKFDKERERNREFVRKFGKVPPKEKVVGDQIIQSVREGF